jgi:Holliday junction resolvase-like predicted endonuclease
VLSRNWIGGGGELDLVVIRSGRLRFVEVKTRGPDDPVGVEAVGSAKRRKLTGAARAWLLDHELDAEEMAFTVALVEPQTITWYDDAFDVE